MADLQVAPAAAAIKAVLDGIPDAGVVFDWQPLPGNDWAEFVRMFTTEVGDPPRREVRAWSVTFTGLRGSYRAIGIGSSKVMREAVFLVRAHVAMRADTEPAFRALLVAAADALDADRDLGGTVIEHDACDVLVPDNGAGLFLGDVLCHYGEITVAARYEVTL